MNTEKCENYRKLHYKWLEVEFLIGKRMGGFHYSAEPVKRFTLMYRIYNDLNKKSCYGNGVAIGYYNTLRAAEQAVNVFGCGRYTIVDELTKHTSHYFGEKK
jgi:hypothetical protein